MTIIATGLGRARQRRRGRRPGLGLRDLRRAARSPPTPTSSRAARAPRSARPSSVFVRFADGNQVPATDRGLRPVLRRRAAEGRPQGPDAAPAAARLDASDLHGRRAGRRDRQPVRRGAVAVGRRHVGDSTARSSRSPASRPPARSRPTRRSTTATRAARCSTAAGACWASTRRSRPRRGDGQRRRLRRPVDTVAPLAGPAAPRRAARATPTSASRPRPSTRSWPRASTLPDAARRLDPGRRRRTGPADRRGLRAGRRRASASRSAPFQHRRRRHHRGRRARRSHAESDLAQALLDLRAGRHGRPSTIRARRRAPRGARSSSASGRSTRRAAAERSTSPASCSSPSPSDPRPSPTTRTSSVAI